MAELKLLLQDKNLMNEIRKSVWEKRQLFTFDFHVDRLLAFFKQVIHESEVKNNSETNTAVLPLIA